MAVTAQSILTKVRDLIVDTGTTQRWSDDELLLYLSDGQRTVVAMDPSSSSTTTVFTLATGTKQTLPATAHMLLSIVRNMAVDGVTPGKVVRVVSKELLDNFNLNWHNATAAAVVQNYVFDPQERTQFYVYPPNTGAGKVELRYAVMPAELTNPSDELGLPDIYQTPLTDYVMFRAHQKDSDFAAGQQVASAYLQLFMAFMGQENTGELANNPNLVMAPPSPASKGTAK